MSRRWFGTDGIRGRAGEFPLLPEFMTRLGRALGEQAAGGEVLLARDTRESGPAIVDALVAGLLGEGASVSDLGVLPTAGLPVAMRARGAALGLVVSASHNPWQDNGVKVFGGGGLKLPDEREAVLETRILALDGAAPRPPRGSSRHENGAAGYVAWLTRRFAGLDLSRCGCSSTAPTARPARPRRPCSPRWVRRSRRSSITPTAATSMPAAAARTCPRCRPRSAAPPATPVSPSTATPTACSSSTPPPHLRWRPRARLPRPAPAQPRPSSPATRWSRPS